MDKLTPSQRAGLEHCRDAEQLLVMTRHLMNGTCPFCDDLQEGDTPWLPIGARHWRIKENRWPMAHTRAHLLLVATEHITHVDQIPTSAWTELGPTIAWVAERYGPINGGIVFRSGSLAHSAGTVEHLHGKILYTDLTGPVRMTLAKETSGPEVERRHRRFHGYVAALPPDAYHYLADRGVGLSSLLVNEIHDPS